MCPAHYTMTLKGIYRYAVGVPSSFAAAKPRAARPTCLRQLFYRALRSPLHRGVDLDEKRHRVG